MGRPRIHNRDLPPRLRLQDGTYYLRTKDGKSKPLGKDRAEALSEYFKLVADTRPLTTLDTIMDRYLREEVPTKAPRTQLDNQKELANLRRSFGHFEPKAVTAQDIYTYLDGRRGKVRANREIALLGHIFKKAIRWGAATLNPCTDIERNPEAPRDRLIGDRELEFFKQHASPLIRAYCEFKELTGMRKGDILTLTRSALQDDGIHYVARKTRRRNPKTGELRGRKRVILWTPELREVVEHILALRQRRRRRVKGKRVPLIDTVYLFATLNGQPYYNPEESQSSGFNAIWGRYMVKAKAAAQSEGWTLEHFTEHDIRAKAGSDAEAAGQKGYKLLGNTEPQFQSTYNRGVEKVLPVSRVR